MAMVRENTMLEPEALGNQEFYFSRREQTNIEGRKANELKPKEIGDRSSRTKLVIGN